MSTGNQKFGTYLPRKYQYQIVIWYFFPKFLGIFLVLCRYLGNNLLKIWLNIGIFRQNKNWFGIWFQWLSFHWYRLISVYLFPENDISSMPWRSFSAHHVTGSADIPGIALGGERTINVYENESHFQQQMTLFWNAI